MPSRPRQIKFALSAEKNDTLDRITGPARTSLKKYHGVSVGRVSGFAGQIIWFVRKITGKFRVNRGILQKFDL